MNTLRSGVIILAAFILSASFSSRVLAQDQNPISDDEVNAVAQDLYCPVCENIPLDVCPTQACADWRELIREKLALGWNTAQIKEFFAEQYGEKVLSVPPRKGFNWLVYLLPPAILVGGIFLTINLVRRAKIHPEPTHQSAPEPLNPVSDDLLDQIENDLKKGS